MSRSSFASYNDSAIKSRFISVFFLGVILAAAFTILALEYIKFDSVYAESQPLQIHNEQLKQTLPLSDVVLVKLHLYKALIEYHWIILFLPLSVVFLVFYIHATFQRHFIFQRILDRSAHFKTQYHNERNRRKTALSELHKSQEHLYKIHEQLSEGFLVIGKEGRIEHLNRVAIQSLADWRGLPKAARHFLGQPIETYFPDYVACGLPNYVRETAQKQIIWQKDIQLESIEVWIHARLYPTTDGDVYFYFQDITEQKQPSSLQKMSDNLLQKINQSVPFAVAVVDREWNYLMMSDFWKDKFQLNDDAIGHSHRMLLPQFPGNWKSLEAQLLEGKSVSNDNAMYTFSGREEWLSWEVLPWRVGEKIRGFIMYAEVNTDSQRDKERLTQQRDREQQLAYHDILTGLPNRQLFYDRLSMSLAQAYRQVGKVACFFLDLDGFKGINDNLGHDVGDLLLKEVAVRLNECVRETDTVARLGGDEFTVILSGIEEREHVTQIAKKIINDINRPFELAGHEIHVSTSLGISLYPQDGSSVNEIIKKSDNAMYASKEAGKNCFTYYGEEKGAPKIKKIEGEVDVSQRDLETHIRVALEKGQLETVFQPQYEIESGKVFGLEALLRWNHPVLGQLTPKSFLTMAENTGAILSIGEWVLENACQKAKQWENKYGQKLMVSVNISKRQLMDEKLLSRVERVMTKTGVVPSSIGFDISESLLVDETEGLKDAIANLRALGCKIIVDDFGLGYTPMMQLKAIKLDAFKIHRSFVRQTNNAEGRAVVRSLITLARTLGIAVLAEGVESEAQVNMLKENGCNHMQGFYFGKPSAADDVTQFFTGGITSGDAAMASAKKNSTKSINN